MAEPESLLRLICPRCQAAFTICRSCYRGQRYCGRSCSHAARRGSCRRAHRRHRQSEAGRLDHRDAERARRARRRARRQVGPSLDRETLVPRLRERLYSAAYEERLAELDGVEGWGVARWREARAEVRAAEGDERLRVWMRRHLTEPAFDEPQARMPPPGLEAGALEAIVEFLLRAPSAP